MAQLRAIDASRKTTKLSTTIDEKEDENEPKYRNKRGKKNERRSNLLRELGVSISRRRRWRNLGVVKRDIVGERALDDVQ